MKRFILILAGLLISNMSAQAVNWQMIETQSPYSNMYVDTDSIKYIDRTHDYFYAVKFTRNQGTEQVAYLRSDFNKDLIGIIRTEDYDYQTYKPKALLKVSRTYMKTVNASNFLYPAHKFVKSISINEEEPQSIDRIEQIIGYDGTRYKSSTIMQTLKYIKNIDKQLKTNWNPPKATNNVEAVINIDINNDGSLKNYQFVKATSDDLTNRSIINAIEQSIPFANLPDKEKEHMLVQITFKQICSIKFVK